MPCPTGCRARAPIHEAVNWARWSLTEAIAFKEKHFPGQGIRIGAQAGFGKFYESRGFQAAGDVYDEDDIAHIDMLKPAVSVAGFAVLR